MAEFPALTLWTDAYLSDTRHLSTVEHGAYLLLLMEAWRRPNCDLPDDDRILARMTGLSGPEWDAIKPVVTAFWKLDKRSKVWKQKRLSAERGFARTRSKSQADKAAKRWNKPIKEDAPAKPRLSRGNAPTATATATATSIEEEGAKAPPSARARKSNPPKSSGTRREAGVDTPIPDDWKPSLGPDGRKIVDGWPPGLIEREAFAFRSHAVANGRLAKNWDAAFGTWISKTETRRIENGQRPQTANGRPIGRTESAFRDLAGELELANPR